jgi:LemA protein
VQDYAAASGRRQPRHRPFVNLKSATGEANPLSTAIVVLVVVVLAAAVWVAYTYNRLVRLRAQVDSAWADIDVQLKRRHDLVPQLVAAVKANAAHERGTLEVVAELRGRALTLSSPARLAEVETALERALGKLFALREAYPALAASGNFIRLQRDLVEVEDHLQYARRFYNGAVRDYNTTVARFPDLVVARTLGFVEREFFQAGAEERRPTSVELGR